MKQIQSEIYPIYPVELSDSGYFFKKNELDESHYLRRGDDFVLPFKGYYAHSILVLGQDELYVLSWKNDNAKDGLWFFNADLQFITDQNLLSDANFSNTNLAKLWHSYLEDVSRRIWYALTTPGLLQSHPNFAPQETFISKSVLQDVQQIINSFIPPWQIVSLDKRDNLASVLGSHYPPIKKDYLVDSLESSDTDNWQDKAVLVGCIEIKCPFSGNLIQSNESIYLGLGKTVFYRFESRGEVFFLISGLNESEKFSVYFPRRNAVCLRTKILEVYIPKSSANFFLMFVQLWCLIRPYLLNNNTKEIVLLSTGSKFLGHSLWNNLSALERMEKNSILSKVSDIYICENNEGFFGSIECLFSTVKSKIRFFNKQTRLNYYKDNKLLFIAGSKFIPRSITDKIINYSLSPSLRKSFSQDMQGFLKERFCIVILFTLRFHNRSWLDQEKGICEIIIRLSQRFSGRIALIIDGHNTNHNGNYLYSMAGNDLEKEKDVQVGEIEYTTAERIRNTISSDRITVINTIGCSVIESINWSLLCDFFVAPWGAGLTKYKWITNSPGLVYSSHKVLTEKPDLHIYDDPQYREDAYPCEYVDPAMVDDISKEGAFRSNFSLSIDHLYEKICSMCSQFSRVHCDME
jgi:hypothetical protein